VDIEETNEIHVDLDLQGRPTSAGHETISFRRGCPTTPRPAARAGRRRAGRARRRKTTPATTLACSTRDSVLTVALHEPAAARAPRARSTLDWSLLARDAGCTFIGPSPSEAPRAPWQLLDAGARRTRRASWVPVPRFSPTTAPTHHAGRHAGRPPTLTLCAGPAASSSPPRRGDPAAAPTPGASTSPAPSLPDSRWWPGDLAQAELPDQPALSLPVVTRRRRPAPPRSSNLAATRPRWSRCSLPTSRAAPYPLPQVTAGRRWCTTFVAGGQEKHLPPPRLTRDTAARRARTRPQAAEETEKPRRARADASVVRRPAHLPATGASSGSTRASRPTPSLLWTRHPLRRRDGATRWWLGWPARDGRPRGAAHPEARGAGALRRPRTRSCSNTPALRRRRRPASGCWRQELGEDRLPTPACAATVHEHEAPGRRHRRPAHEPRKAVSGRATCAGWFAEVDHGHRLSVTCAVSVVDDGGTPRARRAPG